MTTHDKTIFKITTSEAWRQAAHDGIVPPSAIDRHDGFIHLSTSGQLRETLSLHFRGQGGLKVLAVDTGQIAEALKWEPSRNGDLFPHLYASLPCAAIVEVLDVGVDGTGGASLPATFP